MSIYNREEKYIKLLSEREYTVKELAEVLFISEPTVRRDINVMAEKELVTSNRGRVNLKTKSADRRIPLFIRDMEGINEKKEIALKAISLIKDGDVVMLDASTTAYFLLPHLVKFKNITLITNGAKTALEAASLGINTYCTGGEITTESFSYIGTAAENNLREYNADIAFFSCRGLTDDGIASDTSIYENAMRKIMIKNSKRSFLLMVKDKIGNKYLNTLCNIKDIDGVITNA